MTLENAQSGRVEATETTPENTRGRQRTALPVEFEELMRRYDAYLARALPGQTARTYSSAVRVYLAEGYTRAGSRYNTVLRDVSPRAEKAEGKYPAAVPRGSGVKLFQQRHTIVDDCDLIGVELESADHIVPPIISDNDDP